MELQTQIYELVTGDGKMIHVKDHRVPFSLGAAGVAPTTPTEDITFTLEYLLDHETMKVSVKAGESKNRQLRPSNKDLGAFENPEHDASPLSSTCKPFPCFRLRRSLCYGNQSNRHLVGDRWTARRYPCPLECKHIGPWPFVWTEFHVQAYSLILTCRHMYNTAMPILYKKHLFCFDDYEPHNQRHATGT